MPPGLDTWIDGLAKAWDPTASLPSTDFAGAPVLAATTSLQFAAGRFFEVPFLGAGPDFRPGLRRPGGLGD